MIHEAQLIAIVVVLNVLKLPKSLYLNINILSQSSLCFYPLTLHSVVEVGIFAVGCCTEVNLYHVAAVVSDYYVSHRSSFAGSPSFSQCMRSVQGHHLVTNPCVRSHIFCPV